MTTATLDRPRTRETRQRKAILEVVSHSRSHPTAEAICTEVREIIPSVSLATVYRNLDVLKRQGRIREVIGHDRTAHWEVVHEPHAHFICTGCGDIRDVADVPEVDWSVLTELVGCEDVRQRIELTGLCPACARRRRG